MTNNNWERPVCAICRTSKYLTVFHDQVTSWEFPGKFSFVKCTNCGLIFQSPRAPFSQVDQYYPSSNYWGWDLLENKLPATQLIDVDAHYRELYQSIFKSHPHPGSILDVGTGTGLFLTRFKDEGWQVQGTEISSDVAIYARKTFHIPIKVGELTTLKLPSHFYDVVVLNGVLEHVYNPYETLIQSKQLLKEEGLLVVLVPNILSLGHSIFGKEWYHLQPGRHLYHFSPKTINRLLKITGFKIQTLVGSNWTHDYYGLYQSFRYHFSSKFKKSLTGGLAHGTVADLATPSNYSFSKEVGKRIVSLIAWSGATLGRMTGRGEVMVIYAHKTL